MSLDSFNSFNSLINTSQNLLQTFVNSNTFQTQLLSLAFGNQFDLLSLQTLAQQLGQGDFSPLPTVKIRSQSDLGGANGVYVSELNQIFIAQEFIDNASEQQIFDLIH